MFEFIQKKCAGIFNSIPALLLLEEEKGDFSGIKTSNQTPC